MKKNICVLLLLVGLVSLGPAFGMKKKVKTSSMSRSLKRLPEDSILHIFDFLKFSDLFFRIRWVNKWFHVLVCQGSFKQGNRPVLVVAISRAKLTGATQDDALDVLRAGMRKLGQLLLGGRREICLEVRSPEMSDQEFDVVSDELKNFLVVDLDLCYSANLTNQSVTYIARFASVKRIGLNMFDWGPGALCQPSENNFAQLGQLQQLEQVSLGNTGVTDRIFALLPPRITILYLYNCEGVGNCNGADRLENLKDLELGENFGLDDDVVEQLPVSIEELSFAGCNITGAGLNRLTNLRILDMSGTLITDEIISTLPVSLEMINLEDCDELEGEGWNLDRLVNLRKISLRGCANLDNERLAQITQALRDREVEVET